MRPKYLAGRSVILRAAPYAVLVVPALAMTVGPASAATEQFQFLNSQNGSDPWSDLASWSPDHRLPQSGYDAFLVIGPQQSVATRTILYDQPDSPVVALGEVRLDSTSSDGPAVLNLPSGTLQAVNQNVGYNGSAAFNQTGGTNNATTQLYLGQNAGSSGIYTLSNGTLSAGMISVGYNGTGTFSQSGGTISVSQFVNVGDQTTGAGVYDMTGGTLNTSGLTIGFYGSGGFHQSGNSTVNVSDRMLISALPGTGRSYLIQGGTLTTPELDQNGGTFTQTGGSVMARNFQASFTRTSSTGNAIERATIELDGGTFSGGMTIAGGTTLHQAPSHSFRAFLYVKEASTADFEGSVTLTGLNVQDSGTQLTIAQPITWAGTSNPPLCLLATGTTVNLPGGLTIGGPKQPGAATAGGEHFRRERCGLGHRGSGQSRTFSGWRHARAERVRHSRPGYSTRHAGVDPDATGRELHHRFGRHHDWCRGDCQHRVGSFHCERARHEQRHYHL